MTVRVCHDDDKTIRSHTSANVLKGWAIDMRPVPMAEKYYGPGSH